MEFLKTIFNKIKGYVVFALVSISTIMGFIIRKNAKKIKDLSNEISVLKVNSKKEEYSLKELGIKNDLSKLDSEHDRLKAEIEILKKEDIKTYNKDMTDKEIEDLFKKVFKK